METIEDDKAAAIEAAMVAEGVNPHETVQADYFGFEEVHQVFLPDRVSYIEHQTLNEGARRKYLNAVNRDVRVSKATGDAIMSMKSGDENHALLEAAITGWNLVRAGRPVHFSKPELKNFLEHVNPKIVDMILKDVRKHNPWLLAELTVEEIDKEIAALQEMREQRLKEDEGNGS